jgi:hypothetical protein
MYTAEYYSALQKSEIVSFAIKWMALGTTLLSEISQVQKPKYPMFMLICGS